MKNKRRILLACACVAMGASVFTGCKDDYIYDDQLPTWLNGSLYSYFDQNGEYKAYKALIDDLGYADILDRTGTLTLFPANDEAFARYFSALGKSGDVAQLVHGLPESTKKYLYNSSALNMTYLAHQLANIETTDIGGGEGMGLRRNTAATWLDSVPFVDYANLPQNGFWTRFAERGGVYMADNGSRPMLHFTPQFYSYSGLTESDWNVIARGNANMPYDNTGIYINGSHVQPAHTNLICENGYIHVADDVVEPLDNMAEVINREPVTSKFASLMEKFAFPVYNADIDRSVKISKGLPTDGSDSLTFVKRYFNRIDFSSDPDNKVDVQSYGMLLYDPADNQFGGNTDMGAIFVPSNEALEAYWTSPEGAFLRDNYGSLDEVSTNVISAFLQNHQRVSFTGSYPHTWDIMTDPTGLEMGVKEGDVIRTYMANNGVVFLTNRVFPPVDYQCVYAPVLVSPQVSVLNPVIKNEQDDEFNMKYHFYLRSLENRFNLLVPTDEAMKFYRDPVSWAIYANTGRGTREIWSFRLDRGNVVADIYNAAADGTTGAFVKTIGLPSNSDYSNERWMINNRLQDILETHIVVADNETSPYSGYIDDGSLDYLITKGGSLLMPEGSGANVSVKAGGEVENGLEPAHVVMNEDGSRKAYYEMENGHTFFTDKILQDPFKSVYTVMSETPKFTKFFELLAGDANVMSFIHSFKSHEDLTSIFTDAVGQKSSGIGQVVSTFQNYRYTVLVPTDEAIEAAFAADPNLLTWEELDELCTVPTEENVNMVAQKVRYLLEFLHYHFIDGIIPVSQKAQVNGDYDTSARRAVGTGYTPIHADGSNGTLTFSCTTNSQVAHVLTDDASCYNLLTRDFIVNNQDVMSATQITASSRAVLHLVDRALNYHLK